MFLSDGFEGLIWRDPAAPYLTRAAKNQCRSRALIKLKPVHSSEFPVIGYASGKRGAAQEGIVWICRAPSGTEFKVSHKGSIEERRTLFAQCQNSFESLFKGRMLEVEYRELSAAGVPKMAFGIRFRRPGEIVP